MENVATKSFPASSSSTRWSGRTFTRSLLLPLFLALALFALARHTRQQIEVRANRAASTAVPVYLPDIRFLRLVSLGYENALADVLWFRTISYFGLHYRGDRLYPWLARMCDLVTDLDPQAEHVYRFAGVILPWEASRPDQGIQILQKGVRVFPDSWRLNFILGFNHFFFENDIAAALPYIRHAAELPDAHPFMSRLAAMLYTEEYGLNTALAFLDELRGTVEDSSMRGMIEQRMKDIRLTQDLATLRQAVEDYQQRFAKLPQSLDDLVGAGLLQHVPSEPNGGTYTYDPATGKVASSLGYRPLQLYLSPVRSQLSHGIPKE